jgi:hypothetical protein
MRLSRSIAATASEIEPVKLRPLALALLPLLAGAADTARRIGWADLRPFTQAASLFVTPDGETLSEGFAGQRIELAGYLLPVDREDDLVYQFALVPVAGACAHMPQPPPNQIVLVTPERPYRASATYEPVTVTGVLKPGLEMSQLFIVDGVKVITSGYSIGRAAVIHAQRVPDAVEAPTPWRFLGK